MSPGADKHILVPIRMTQQREKRTSHRQSGETLTSLKLWQGEDEQFDEVRDRNVLF
jgi:hypothetical protein